MNKKYFAVIAATLAFATVFAACTKRYNDDRILVDSEGNTHILATNAEGETMQDEYGNIVEVITDDKGKEVEDKAGEQQTQGVTYPDLLTNGNIVQNKFIKLEVPDGWEQIGKLNILLSNKDFDAKIQFLINEDKSIDKVLSEYILNGQELKKQVNKKLEKFNMSNKEVTIGGKKMTKIVWEITSKKEYVDEGSAQSWIQNVYLYSDGKNTYNYASYISAADRDKVDFDKIVASVIYK